MFQQVWIDLNGDWDFLTDAEETGEKRRLELPEGEQAEWGKITVPSHWQKAGYEDYQGTAWYRKTFQAGAKKEDACIHLHFDAVDYFAEVWLNGEYLGFHEGDFAPFEFDVTRKIKYGQKNTICVKVSAPIDSHPEKKAIAKGGIYHWDCLPVRQEGLKNCPEVPSAANPQYPNPLVNPGGIWRDVYLIRRPKIYVERTQITPVVEGNGQDCGFYVETVVVNRAEQVRKATLSCEAVPHNFQADSRGTFTLTRVLKPGRNVVGEWLPIRRPFLWWSWDLGFPHLYRLNLQLQAENMRDERTEIAGLRRFAKDEKWGLYLNGKRFFARGNNYLSNQFLSLSDEKTYEKDLSYMLEANMNMCRVFSHMENEAFYRLCDEKGIMVFQDLPFQWGYRSDGLFIQRAKRIAQDFVTHLYNHPSVVIWCCHSESRFHDYNKLDNVLVDTVRSLDPYRVVHKNSVLVAEGELPVFFEDMKKFEEFSRKHISVHWVGWYWGKVEDAPYYDKPLFVTEYGTQSLPEKDSLSKFISDEDLWPSNWEEWRRRGFQLNIYENNLGRVPESLEEMIRKTQRYQARFYKLHTEHLRCKKYRHVNGLLQFHFVNTWPAIDWSVLDYYRRKKAAFEVLKDAFAPLLLTFQGRVEPDKNKLRAESWVVNDFHHSYEGCRIIWEIAHSASGRKLCHREIQVDRIAPDSSEPYDVVELSLPEKAEKNDWVAKGRLIDAKGEVLSENVCELLSAVHPDLVVTPEKATVGLL